MNAVELRSVGKRFGPVLANADISLQAKAGSIHAIVGENGAGKSTAMKMLYGIYRPDSGEILVNGVKREWKSPADAIRAGIGMVHQHFMLAGPYTALDNVLVGAEPALGATRFLPRPFRALDRARARRALDGLGRSYGLEVDWDALVEELPVGVQQRIEILKLLYRDANILILDEPTAVLTPQETTDLFSNLRKLATQGKTILIITHKLKEVMSLADRATVFRAGRIVGEREIGQTDPAELASLMVGRKVSLTVEAPPEPRPGAAVLEARGLSLENARGSRRQLERVSFTIHGGEIVGIAGVEGNGQSELLEALLHPRELGRRIGGELRILGRDAMAMGAREIRDLGVGLVPEDRLRQALLLEAPVTENFLLGLQRRPEFSRRGFVARQNLRRATERAIETYDVRPRQTEIAAGRMSGGNQQKLVIAREFEREPRLLIASQPTRGVDVGAIELIHGRILEARAGGAGILLVSSELDEILALSDRILVMYEGRIVAEFARGQVDETRLGISMSGAESA